MSDAPAKDWMSPAELGAEMGRPARWVAERMAAGEIPAIKIARRWYFTPECRERLVAKHLDGVTLDDAPVTDQWGRSGARGQKAS